MSKLSAIKERAGSVEKIKKITGALEVVAVTRLRRQQKNTLEARPYSEKIRELMLDISRNVGNKAHPLFSAHERPENAVFIVASSDKGLCGGFNNMVVNKAQHLYEEKRDLRVKFVTIGKKGHDFLADKGRDIKDYIFGLSRDNEELTKDVYRISDELIKDFLNHKLDELYIIYNHFKMQLLGEARVEKLLPVTLESKKEGKQKNRIKRDYIFEPGTYEVFDALIREYLRNQVLHAVIESKTSEEMARMVAMKKATDSAAKLIEDLMLKFHKERQRSITNELIDIINAVQRGE